MKCPVCNTENPNDVNFCQGCCRKIPRCSTCGVELTTKDRFCSQCGTRLSDDLLLLVPEEAVLQAPVWSQSGPATTQSFDDDWTEGTARAGEEPVVQTTVNSGWTDAFSEDTVRSAPGSGAAVGGSAGGFSDWNANPVVPEPPKRAFCERCGKRIAPGSRLCPDCQAASVKTGSRNKGNKGKVILIILLILALLAGLFAGGYALINSDLFDWDSSSSNRAEKDKDDDDEDEDEDEDDDDGEGSGAASGDMTPAVPEDIPTEAPPATEAPGVEDPVVTDPIATQPATEATVANDPLLYWIENCDKMYLTMADLDGFDKQMCTYARNACYAKSGRMFNSSELQAYFSQFAWYNPTVSPDRFNASMLNAYQNANINLVLEYERAHGYN